MIRIMESIFQTHCPMWDDITQLRVSLFNTEERHRILTAARKWLGEMASEGSINPQWWAELATLMRGPTGTEGGRGHLERFGAAILQGPNRGAQKLINMTKTSE